MIVLSLQPIICAYETITQKTKNPRLEKEKQEEEMSRKGGTNKRGVLMCTFSMIFDWIKHIGLF